MLTVTKRFKFCYGHRLPNYNGKCSNQHGHNATLEVEIGNSFNADTGMVVDFVELKKVVNEKVVNYLDHQYLNELSMFTNSKISKEMTTNRVFEKMVSNPTAENTVNWIVYCLYPVYKNTLLRVRLYETDDSYCEWRKDT